MEFAHVLSPGSPAVLERPVGARRTALAPRTVQAPRHSNRRTGLFLVFSTLIINAGVSPLQAPLFADDRVAQLGATALGILWWLYAARVLTEVMAWC
jgi:hypothetical protein